MPASAPVQLAPHDREAVVVDGHARSRRRARSPGVPRSSRRRPVRSGYASTAAKPRAARSAQTSSTSAARGPAARRRGGGDAGDDRGQRAVGQLRVQLAQALGPRVRRERPELRIGDRRSPSSSRPARSEPKTPRPRSSRPSLRGTPDGRGRSRWVVGAKGFGRRGETSSPSISVERSGAGRRGGVSRGRCGANGLSPSDGLVGGGARLGASSQERALASRGRRPPSSRRCGGRNAGRRMAAAPGTSPSMTSTMRSVLMTGSVGARQAPHGLRKIGRGPLGQAAVQEVYADAPTVSTATSATEARRPERARGRLHRWGHRQTGDGRDGDADQRADRDRLIAAERCQQRRHDVS